jgi:hypothetical protein
MRNLVVLFMVVSNLGCGRPEPDDCAGLDCSMEPPESSDVPPEIVLESLPDEPAKIWARVTAPATPFRTRPHDTGTCAPSVKIGEALPEPEAGWEAVRLLPADFSISAPTTPFGTYEAKPCIEDGRPALDQWCERLEYQRGEGLVSVSYQVRDDEGRVRVLRSGRPGAPETIATYDESGRTLTERVHMRGYAQTYEHEFRYDADGEIAEWFYRPLRDGSHDGMVAHWALHRACDGRPSHYDDMISGTPAAEFLYDETGRVLQSVGPGRSTRRAFDADGLLRADEGSTWTNDFTRTTTRYFDRAGLEIGRRLYFNTHMGTVTTLSAFDYLAGSSRPMRTRVSTSSFSRTDGLLVHAYDDEGRETLISTSFSHASVPRIERRTWVCESTVDEAEYELDSDGDGEGDWRYAYEWDPETRSIRTGGSPSAQTYEYRFDCSK